MSYETNIHMWAVYYERIFLHHYPDADIVSINWQDGTVIITARLQGTIRHVTITSTVAV